MNEHNELFAGFARLAPSPEESAQAVEAARRAIVAAASNGTTDPRADGVRPSADRASTASCDGRGELCFEHDAPVPLNATQATELRERRTVVGKRLLRAGAGLAAAAVVLVAVGLLVSMNSQPALAWHDPIRRMVEARSLRCVVETMTPNGEWTKSWEVQFDQQRGVVERHYENNIVVRTEFDDGRNHWIQRHGQEIVTRGAGIDAATHLEKLLSPLATDKSFQPDPTGDQVIGGIACRNFSTIDDERGQRVSMWIDEHQQLRRAQIARRVNDVWVDSYRANVAHDVEIEPAEFQPQFGEDAKVVDLSKLFDEMFSLQEAVHREERFGYILAIHELKRIDEFEYYLLMSFRPTVETRRKLTLAAGEAAGFLHPTVRHKLTHPIELETGRILATARADGVEIVAYVWRVSGPDLMPIERARPQFKLNAHANLWKEVGATNDIHFNLPLPDAPTPLRAVIRSVYDTIAILEAVPMDALYLHDLLDQREHIDREGRGGMTIVTKRKHLPRPSEISFEEFFKHVAEIRRSQAPTVTTSPAGME